MVQTYEYIKLIGLLAFLGGILKLILGFLGYSFGGEVKKSIKRLMNTANQEDTMKTKLLILFVSLSIIVLFMFSGKGDDKG